MAATIPSLSLALRVRRPAFAVPFGFAGTSILITALVSISMAFHFAAPNILVTLTLAILSLLGLSLYFRNPDYWTTLGISAFLAATSWVLKFVFEIGERASSDSANIFEIALRFFQKGQPAENVLRGLTAPSLTSIGTEGYAFTIWPFIGFCVLVILSLAIASEIAPHVLKVRHVLWSTLAVWVFLLTSPIVRINIFYVSNHTLAAIAMGLCALAIVTQVREIRPPVHTIPLLSAGSLLATLSRPEGILISGVALVLFTGFSLNLNTRTLLSIAAISSMNGVAFSTWFALIEPERIPMDLRGFMVLAAVGPAAGVWAVALISKNSRMEIPVILTGILLLLLIAVTYLGRQSLSAQFKNFALGAGGWGFTIPVLVALLFIIPRTFNNRQQRALVISAVAFAATLIIAKWIGDASLGRQGFADSLNRAALHFLGISAALATANFYQFGRAIHRVLEAVANATSVPKEPRERSEV